MAENALPTDYSVRFYFSTGGQVFPSEPVTILLAVYQKLEADHLNYLASGQPKGGAYPVLREPKVEATVVLDFAKVAGFGGI